jgi:hypothetical protein
VRRSTNKIGSMHHTLQTKNPTYRALQRYVHDFHAARDHAMCNIEHRFIPVVQVTQLRKLSNENFKGSSLSQKLTVMPSASVERGSMNGGGGAWLKE